MVPIQVLNIFTVRLITNIFIRLFDFSCQYLSVAFNQQVPASTVAVR